MATQSDKGPQILKIAHGSKNELEAKLQRRTTILIGRGTDCDVVIKDVKASRNHCRLTRQEAAFLLEDLASKNGTYVNGSRISAPVLLQANQTFKIGDTVFYLSP